MYIVLICCFSWDPKDCSLPDSSVHGASQERMLVWVAISFSRGSSPLSDQTRVFSIAGGFFIKHSRTILPCALSNYFI